ncbi:hypothetical protein F4824DRAFT_504094 [Ustulina deusta]|nr:hypothetical protein F4824DRAFT_504094 [Ustulina deusta]
MYRELHKRNEDSTQKGDMDDAPDDKFIYLMPLTIEGYNFKRKHVLARTRALRRDSGFDEQSVHEAFKSRIFQLSENEDGIDLVELKDNTEELAKYKLNGREIRDVITTARQYARWERQRPNRQHIQLDYKMVKEHKKTGLRFGDDA